MMRACGAAVAAALAMVSVGCGSSQDNTAHLSVRILSPHGASVTRQSFTLRCDPNGGAIPHRTELCRMIAEHPDAMLFPGRSHTSCAGGVNGPASVSVSGTWRDRRVRFTNKVVCEWPGSVAASAYWTAVSLPHYLPVASLHLSCAEDDALLEEPIPWKRVRDCLSKVPSDWDPNKG